MIIAITDFVPLASRSIGHPEDDENGPKHVALLAK